MVEQKLRTNLELIHECDNFPYFHDDPLEYQRHIQTYYHLRVSDEPATLGYLLPSVAQVFKGLESWDLDEDDRVLTLTAGHDVETRSAAVAATTAAMRQVGHFKVLQGWRDELYPVFGKGGKHLFDVERSAACLFGVITYGVHMTAYVRSKEDGKIKIWVPRRATNKQTYPGMLDNTVGGGLASGEQPFEALVRECAEEASIPEDLVRERATAVAGVTYFYIRDHRAGGESGMMQPECQYVYDLELPEDFKLKPSDDEVQEFNLLTVEETQAAMSRAEFKPNCALVLLDFFVRHGILNCENEQDYFEITTRTHRRLEFPMPRPPVTTANGTGLCGR
ncbi:thiamine pyrophosphokinase-related protein-like protein [Patellaria atrata CBS 101060]|uniref:Thiamine pyrophosphokinase-related protein-like protein n=1 Tax=Patellaria atrata CBS 101060 TaxID=1346257 RepID=A0A9P4SC21_9PEZI|nr:thiamine pyrophosphokinase-related protein-like protein [Patellaria atrata CBS 101060]